MDPTRHPLFSAGYRPFFLLGALNAVGSMAPWLLLLAGTAVPTQGWPPQTLHAHEMLYGTVVAAIAGFLLTAVPNWTGTAPVVGRRLAALVGLWLAGRVLLVLSGPVAPTVVAVVDVAFLPVLAWTVGRPIAASGSWRNGGVVAILLLLAAANAAIHTGHITGRVTAVRVGTAGAVYAVVLLMLVISGRIVPLFTGNVLRRRGVAAAVRRYPRIGAAGIALAAGVLLLELRRPGEPLTGWLALATAGLLAVRQSGWQTRRVSGEPMLWVLHAGHAWLVLGFACLAYQDLRGGMVGAGALHAFTAGAMGTLILGVMPRVTLGHGGRPITASAATRGLFALVIVGALLRVGGALGIPGLYEPGLLLGGGLWTAAWVVFCASYGRALVGPRAEAPA